MKRGSARITCILIMMLFSAPLAARDLPVIGWLENVLIEGGKLEFEAKIDTGADISSVNAQSVHQYTRDGEDWLKVRLVNKEGKSVTLDKKLVRYAIIKRKQAEPVRRPVINLSLCVGHIERSVEVNLAKRNNYKYKMLIGRNYLRDSYLASSSNVFSTKPLCR